MNPIFKLAIVLVVATLLPKARGMDPWQEEMLAKENGHRADHSAPPLEYNEELAAGAQEWANYLAQQCHLLKVLNHSGEAAREFQGGHAGENIYLGLYKHMGSAPHAADNWYSEIKDYRWGENYQGSGVNSEGIPIKVGHLTQQLWVGTSMVGYGVALCKHLYVVARYYPPGNVHGTYNENVLPPH